MVLRSTAVRRFASRLIPSACARFTKATQALALVVLALISLGANQATAQSAVVWGVVPIQSLTGSPVQMAFGTVQQSPLSYIDASGNVWLEPQQTDTIWSAPVQDTGFSNATAIAEDYFSGRWVATYSSGTVTIYYAQYQNPSYPPSQKVISFASVSPVTYMTLDAGNENNSSQETLYFTIGTTGTIYNLPLYTTCYYNHNCTLAAATLLYTEGSAITGLSGGHVDGNVLYYSTGNTVKAINNSTLAVSTVYTAGPNDVLSQVSYLSLYGGVYVLDQTTKQILYTISGGLSHSNYNVAVGTGLGAAGGGYVVATAADGVTASTALAAANSSSANYDVYFTTGSSTSDIQPLYTGTSPIRNELDFGQVYDNTTVQGHLYVLVAQASDSMSNAKVPPAPFSNIAADDTCTSAGGAAYTTVTIDVTPCSQTISFSPTAPLSATPKDALQISSATQVSFYVSGYPTVPPQTYSAANSTVTAPGSSTAGTSVTVTATVNDTTGAPFAGQTVTLTPSSPSGNAALTNISNGGVSNSSGVVTATLNDTTAETTTVSASVGGTAFTTSASTNFTPGPVNAAQSTVVPTTSSITAGNTTSVTVTLKDANGNVIPNTPVQLLRDNTATVTPSTATNTNNVGQVVFTVGDQTAEQDYFTAISGSTVVAQEGAVNVVAGPVATGSGFTATGGSLTVGSATSLQVLLVDQYGNPISGVPVNVTTTGGTLGTSPQNTNGQGRAVFSINDTKVETDTYNASVANVSLTYPQSQIQWTLGSLSPSVSTVVASSTSVTAGNTTTVTVTATDQYSNPISGQTVTLTGTNNATVNTISGTTNSSGQASFTVGDTTAEQDTFTARVNGTALSTTPQITFNPGAPSAAQSSVIATSTSVNAQSTTTITVTLRDSNGNTVPGTSVSLTASPSSSGSPTTGGTQLTSNSGVASFTVSDSIAESDTFTAHAANLTLAQTATITFNPLSQTITFASFNPSSLALTPGGTVSVPAASASSSLSVSFSTTSPACSVSGTTVSLLHVGACVITASQSGNQTYSAATSKNAQLNITIGANVITFAAFPNANYNYGSTPPSLSSVSASSTLPISFSAAYPANCTVANGVITLVGIGTCSITASQSGNSDYAAATAISQTFQVIQGINTVSFTQAPGNLTYQQTEALSATAVSGLTPVVFSATGGCSVSGSTLTGTQAGSSNCVITATQAGNTLWAQGQVQATVSVQQAQTQGNFSLSPVSYSPGATINAASYLNTNNSGGSQSYSGGTPNVCSISNGGTISILGGGSCTFSVAVGSTTNYTGGNISGSLTINPASQTVNFGSFSTNSVAFPGPAPTLPAASAQTSLSYSSTNTSVCTIGSGGGTITINSVGNCTIQATAASSASYQTASATSSFTVTGGANTISFPSLGSTSFSPGTTTSASASSTAGTTVVPIVYTSNTPTVCSVNNSTLTITALMGGSCIIAASQVAGGNYLPASNNGVTSTWTINPGTQTVSFNSFNPSSVSFVAGAANVPSLPSASAPGGPITYSSTTPAVCSISSSGAGLSYSSIGGCTIQATSAANASYTQASASSGFNITAGTDTITLTPLTPIGYSPGATVTVSATSTAGTSQQPILFSTSTPSVCSVSGTTVTVKTGGTCTVLADQAAGGNYAQAAEASTSLVINPATQALSFPSFQNVPIAYGSAAPSIPTATALGGATISYTSLTSSVCTVNGSSISVLTAGTCTVQASAAPTASYLSATATQGFTINQASQTITFTVPANTNYSPSPATIPLGATASSGLQVSYSASPSSVCTLNGAGTAILMQGLGTCNVTASQSGNINYTPAANSSGSFQVLLGTNTITFNAFSPSSVALSGTPPSLATSSTPTSSAGTAYATSGLTVTFSSLYPSICSVSGTTITLTKTGTCTILAAQSGNALYGNAAGVTQSFVIALGSQTITFPNPGSQAYTTALIPLNATTSANAASGLTVSYTSNNTSVCTISASGTAAQLVGLGSCSITATQAGDNINYAAAAPVNVQFNVTAATNVVNILPPGGTTFGSSVTSYVSANSTAGVTSQNPIIFGSATPLICSVSSAGVMTAGNTILGEGQITVLSAGNCGITASQAASGNYAAAPTVQANFVISQAPQTLTFAPFSSSQISYGSAAPALPVATALGSATITFSSLTTSICTLTSNTSSATILYSASGTCTIQASAAATTNYQAATATQSFSISTSNNIINISPLSTVIFGSVGSVQASATSTAGTSTTAIVFGSTSADSGICSVSSTGLITISGGGSCIITANQNATNGYNQAQQASAMLTISPAAQTVVFPSFSAGSIAFGTSAPSLPTASGPSLGGAITYASLNTSVCTLSSNQSSATISVLSTGSCIIQATAAASASYQQGSASQSFSITSGNNILSFPSLGSILFSPGATATAAATSSASPTGTGISYGVTAADSGICTINGTTISIVSGGSCVITANQGATGNYSAASQVTSTLTINPGPQSVTFGSFVPPSIVYGTTVPTLPAASAPGGPLSFASLTTGVCTINSNGTGLTVLSTGACTIQATSSATVSYQQAAATSGFSITGSTNTISFPSLGSITYGSAAPTATATSTASPNGSGILFAATSADANICAVSSSGVITVLGGGSCVVTANQGATGNFAAASQATSTLTINPATQTVTFGVFSPSSILIGTSAPPLPTASAPGGPITYASLTTPVCTISGTTITVVTTGTCTIQATSAANASYLSASSSSSFTIANGTNVITFAPFNPSSVSFTATPPALTASASSNLAIVYSSTTATTCSVSGSTITFLASGVCSITASQPGNISYVTATPVSQSFTITPVPFGFTVSAASQEIIAGSSANFSFSLTPTSGVYPGPVSFSITGLPSGVTATFSPTTVASNAGAQTVTLTVSTPVTLVKNSQHDKVPWTLALLLPLFLLRRSRRKLVQLLVLAVFVSTSLFALNGCSHPSTGTNSVGVTSQSYNFTVTATSGTQIESTTITLIVQ